MPMYQALAEEVRRLIEAGVLNEGDVLPGSRDLAQTLGISRKTVVTAMDKLIYAGLLDRKPRVGLFVSAQHRGATANAQVEEKKEVADVAPRLVLGPDMPDSSLMPAIELSRAYRLFFNRSAKWKKLDYSDPKGVEPFRKVISLALCHSRSLSYNMDEVLITRGSQQALYLTAHALLKVGDALAIEEGAHSLAVRAFETAGLRLIPIPVDGNGIKVDCLAEVIAANPDLRAVYVTPRYNYPTTVPLSADRCKMLAKLVIDHDLLLIDDDFDSLLSFTGLLAPALSGLIPKTNYIYMCTASRVLAPAVRIGFVAGSIEHINRMAYYRECVDAQGDPIMERALLELIEQGEIRRHLRHLAVVYTDRLDYISQRITQELKGRVHYHRPQGGLAIWLEMLDDPLPLLQKKHIAATVHTLPHGGYGLRIGYATMSKEDVDLLVEALKG